MNNSKCKCGHELEFYLTTGYCFECANYAIYCKSPGSQKREYVYTYNHNPNKDIEKLGYILQIHPMELYQNMIQDIPMQSHNVYTSSFDMQELRDKQVKEIHRLGSKFSMDYPTMQIAIRLFDIVLYKIHLLEKENITMAHSGSSPRSNSRIAYAVFKRSDALFMNHYSPDRLRSLNCLSMELVMITCVLIASKYFEIDENLIRIYELEKEYKYAYTFKNITQCEVKILEELNWNFLIQTPFTYTSLFISSGVLFSDDKIDNKILTEANVNDDLIKEIYNDLSNEVRHLMNICSKHYDMLKFEDRIIALVCILSARKKQNIFPVYSTHFEQLYNLSYEDCSGAYEMLESLIPSEQRLKKDNSYSSIPETPSRRSKNVEVIVCNLDEEPESHRYAKLYPLKGERTKSCIPDSPIGPKNQFSDYLNHVELDDTNHASFVKHENSATLKSDKVDSANFSCKSDLSSLSQKLNANSKRPCAKLKRERYYKASSQACEAKDTIPEPRSSNIKMNKFSSNIDLSQELTVDSSAKKIKSSKVVPIVSYDIRKHMKQRDEKKLSDIGSMVSKSAVKEPTKFKPKSKRSTKSLKKHLFKLNVDSSESNGSAKKMNTDIDEPKFNKATNSLIVTNGNMLKSGLIRLQETQGSSKKTPFLASGSLIAQKKRSAKYKNMKVSSHEVYDAMGRNKVKPSVCSQFSGKRKSMDQEHVVDDSATLSDSAFPTTSQFVFQSNLTKLKCGRNAAINVGSGANSVNLLQGDLDDVEGEMSGKIRNFTHSQCQDMTAFMDLKNDQDNLDDYEGVHANQAKHTPDKHTFSQI